MSELIPIKKAPGFVKDTQTGVVINTNNAEYQLILEKRANKKHISKLQNELDEIRQMIRKLQ